MTGQLNNSNNSINFLLDLWFYAIFIFCAFIELNELNCVIITGKKNQPRKNHVVILINAEKVVGKIRTSSKLRLGERVSHSVMSNFL